MAVEQVFGATTAWVSDVDKGACKILAHRYPDVPNLGDITAIDWAAVEPVDIITGGSPCQDLSHAGKRSGMTEGTRSNLWVAMREAIAQLKPSIVVWENVRGAYSATADSDLEHCQGCMGDPADRGPVLRALGRVLGDLSDLGYDTQWHGLRAADVGAPHGRFRVFVVARLADADLPRPQRPYDSPGTTSTERRGHTRPRADSDTAGSLLPTPSCSDTNGAGLHYTNFGDYTPAVARWESVIGRPAPEPTQPSKKGNPQLSPQFVEWMMGLSDGWITDVPGITRNEALKACGNGVVPKQAAYAISHLLERSEAYRSV
jgi:DNA (cytosine-5)-methyltransferase 1